MSNVWWQSLSFLFWQRTAQLNSKTQTVQSFTYCFITHAGKHNSRTVLLPLLQRFPEQMRVSLYHTPDLRGLLRLLVPERFNETIGVQHIKAYLFDNSLIISGCVGRRHFHFQALSCGKCCDENDGADKAHIHKRDALWPSNNNVLAM